MFEDINEALQFVAKKDQDGGIPFFRHEAVEVKNSDPVKFQDEVWVTIVNKGDPKSIIERPKRPEDEKRWPDHWEAFVKGNETPLKGIPLKDFPALTPADIATCHRYHIRTVEDLADYPDIQLKNLGGRGVSLKQQAIKFIEYRQGPDIDELKEQIKRLEKLVGDTQNDVPERTAGDGVSKPKHSRRKQQSRRKSNTTDSKDSGAEAG
jgi:hypothetical protein